MTEVAQAYWIGVGSALIAVVFIRFLMKRE